MTVSQERAQNLARLFFEPFMPTDDVSEITGVPPVTIRQWMNRGHLEFRGTPRVRQGKAMCYSPANVVETMAFAYISHLGLPPNRFAGQVASLVMSAASRYLHDMAGTWGDYASRTEAEKNWQRYIIAYYDPSYKALRWVESSVPTLQFQPPDAAWIVLDSHLLLDRTIQGIDALAARKAATE